MNFVFVFDITQPKLKRCHLKTMKLFRATLLKNRWHWNSPQIIFFLPKYKVYCSRGDYALFLSRCLRKKKITRNIKSLMKNVINYLWIKIEKSWWQFLTIYFFVLKHNKNTMKCFKLSYEKLQQKPFKCSHEQLQRMRYHFTFYAHIVFYFFWSLKICCFFYEFQHILKHCLFLIENCDHFCAKKKQSLLMLFNCKWKTPCNEISLIGFTMKIANLN